ncbi:MAG: ribosome biogenesis GTP-binding protein YihA/YsxC [Acidobacteria bacterium]|jgi:GTP-binding protein|nr:ribosome biogenesis GTP-binding protein YihA/YsxC [Acidobacteriota bacterium]
MNIHTTELAGTYFTPEQLPADRRPKVLFFGRSNVGKSSLINSLLGRRLARTSSTPGKTLSVNYYRVDGSLGRLLFVDLPGYGFAKVSKDEALRVRRLFAGFLERAENVRLALLLVDSRHGFLPPDLETLAQIVEKNLPILTILTKSDKISFSEQRKLIANLQKQFGLLAIPFSIKSPAGKGEIWKRIQEAI